MCPPTIGKRMGSLCYKLAFSCRAAAAKWRFAWAGAVQSHAETICQHILDVYVYNLPKSGNIKARTWRSLCLTLPTFKSPDRYRRWFIELINQKPWCKDAKKSGTYSLCRTIRWQIISDSLVCYLYEVQANTSPCFSRTNYKFDLAYSPHWLLWICLLSNVKGF